MTTIGNISYFTANDGSNIDVRSLWRTDGTTEGTYVVNRTAKSPNLLTTIGNTLYFITRDTNDGTELWKSNGSSVSTELVKAITPNTNSSSSPPLGDLPLTVIGNMLYFSANDGETGYELWKSDGSNANTKLVKDINFGVNSSFPGFDSAVMDNTLFFAANDGINGIELWKSNGTPDGTKMVKNIDTSPNTGGIPSSYTVVGNTLFFSADDGINGTELWKSDGTASGTNIVIDIGDGFISSFPLGLIALGNTLYFAATLTANIALGSSSLWKSDGTANGTQLLLDFDSLGLTVIEKTIYFTADDGINGYELWKSNGSPATTQLVKNIDNDDTSSFPIGFTAAGNGFFYFTAKNGINGRELWKSDGTSINTELVFNLNAGPDLGLLKILND